MSVIRFGKYRNEQSTLQLALNDYAIGQAHRLFGTNDVVANPGDHLFCNFQDDTNRDFMGYCGVASTEYKGFKQIWALPWKHIYWHDGSGSLNKYMSMYDFLHLVNSACPTSHVLRKSVLAHQAAPKIDVKSDLGKAILKIIPKMC